MVLALQLVGAGGGEGWEGWGVCQGWCDGVPALLNGTDYGISFLGQFSLGSEWVVLKMTSQIVRI